MAFVATEKGERMMAYKRKYHKGEKIASLDELAKQEFVYFFDKITHRGWFMSWQFSLAQRYIERGFLYYAVRTSEERGEDNDHRKHK